MKVVLCSIVACSVRSCSIVHVFDFRTFDCVRLAKCFGEFDYRTQSKSIERLEFDRVRLPNVRLTTPEIFQSFGLQYTFFRLVRRLRASSHKPGWPGWPGLPGPISPWVQVRNFSPVSEMRTGQISSRRFLARNAKKQTCRSTKISHNFRASHSFGNSYSCITAVKSDAYVVGNTPGKARRSGRSELIPLCRLLRSRMEKPRSREPIQPALSYEHIENFTKDLEIRRDLGNRAHVKRP